jgi:hypothetical protein
MKPWERAPPRTMRSHPLPARKLDQDAVAGGLDHAALCSAVPGSISSRRCNFRRARVPASSDPISRLYPAASAARMARAGARPALRSKFPRRGAPRKPGSPGDSISLTLLLRRKPINRAAGRLGPSAVVALTRARLQIGGSTYISQWPLPSRADLSWYGHDGPQWVRLQRFDPGRAKVRYRREGVIGGVGRDGLVSTDRDVGPTAAAGFRLAPEWRRGHTCAGMAGGT